MTSAERGAGARRRLAERIQVHDHEVDGADAVLGDRLHVLGQVAAREQAAVHRRMQRLHPAVEHLGKPRDAPTSRTASPASRSALRRAAGGDELPARAT